MYCRNCGNPLPGGAACCPQCGVISGQGAGHCPNCGAPVAPGTSFCPQCGGGIQGYPVYVQRSRLAAGLLGIFLGGLGIHNFYLGFQSRALVQLLVSLIGGLLTCGIATAAMSIWGLVEGILILTDPNRIDANGYLLKD